MAITPTISSPGFRVIRVGLGLDYANLDAAVNYANTVDIITNKEILCLELYENQTLKTDVSGYGGGTSQYYILIRPVPGLDVATTEAGNPLAYGTTGIEITVALGVNTAPTLTHRPGAIFDGVKFKFTSVANANAPAISAKYNYGSIRQGYRKCRFYIDTPFSPLKVGEEYGIGAVTDSLIVFGPTCTSRFVDNYGQSSIWLERNTFVRLGTAGNVSGSFGGSCIVRDNAFVNMGAAAIPGLAGTVANNISSNSLDAGTGFTIVAPNTMVVNETTNFRPKPNGPLIGTASTNSVNTFDVENVSRGSTPNVGAGQTPGVVPDSTLITSSGTPQATVGFAKRMRFSTDNGLKDGQTATLSFAGTGFTTSIANPVLSKDVPYVDVDFTFTGALGSRSVTISSTGTPALTNLVLSFTIVAPVDASSLVLSGPAVAVGGTPITVGVTTNSPLRDSQTLSIAFSDADNGVFSPNPLVLNASSYTKDVTYTPKETTSGSHTITTTTTASTGLTIASATKVVSVTAAPPKYLIGENSYDLGVGRQFVTWNDLCVFLDGKDNVTTKAIVIVNFHSDITITRNLNVNASSDYPVLLRPAPGKGFADLEPGPQRWIPTLGVKLIASTAGKITIAAGVNIEGFQIVFPNAGVVLEYGSAYRSGSTGFRRNIINVTATTGSGFITSGNAARDCAMVSNIMIKHGGTGTIADLVDGNAIFAQNTLYGMDGFTGNSLVTYGSFGGKGAVQGNAAYNAGPTPIYFNASVSATNFKGNTTNVVPTGNSVNGFTYKTTAFFQAVDSDIRPATGGALIGAGSSLAVSTNDAYGKNYGTSPDAGAIQLNFAPPLPSATLTTFNGVNGQKLTLDFNTTNTPTSGVGTLMPDMTTPDGAATNFGIVTFPTSTTCRVIFTMIMPGNYYFKGTVTNDGGTANMGTVPFVTVLGFDGSPYGPTIQSDGGTTPVATVTSVTVTPVNVTQSSGTIQFVPVVNGTNMPSQEVSRSFSAGTMNVNNLFTIPAQTSVEQVITVTFRSTLDTTKFVTTTVTVPAAVVAVPTVTNVTITPTTITQATGTIQFSHVVNGTNSPEQTVTRTASAGSISSSGLLTLPTQTNAVQTVTVKFTSTVDTSKSATATVTIPALVVVPTVTSVTVTPMTITQATGTIQFTPGVVGTNSPAQTVTRTTSAGSIDSSNLFTLPAQTTATQTVTIVFTSTVDTSKSVTATVTIPGLTSTTNSIYPAPSTVLLGVKYGPTGTEFTGTFVAASVSITVGEIAAAVRAAISGELDKINMLQNAPSSTNVASAVRLELGTELTKLTALTNAPSPTTVAAAVRTELGTELLKLTSLQNAPTADSVAAASAIAVRQNIGTELAKITTLNNAPTALSVASAVRESISAELIHLNSLENSSASIDPSLIANAVRNELAPEMGKINTLKTDLTTVVNNVPAGVRTNLAPELVKVNTMKSDLTMIINGVPASVQVALAPQLGKIDALAVSSDLSVLPAAIRAELAPELSKITTLQSPPSALAISTAVASVMSPKIDVIGSQVVSSLVPQFDNIAPAIRDELAPELSKINTIENGLTSDQTKMMLEIYRLYGLDPTVPLIVTDENRTAGDITQSIFSSDNTTTITRI